MKIRHFDFSYHVGVTWGLSEKMKNDKQPIHSLGKADDNGKDKYFLVSKDLILDNYKTKDGPVFKPSFFKLQYNQEKTIPQIDSFFNIDFNRFSAIWEPKMAPR